MRIWLTGGSGLLGYALSRIAPADWELTTVARRAYPVHSDNVTALKLDLTDRAAVIRRLQHDRPHVIIHTGSMGDLDACERDRETADRINVGVTQTLVEVAAAWQPLFVFTSTMYVFDGTRAPYDETAEPAPLMYYGHTKLRGEQLVQAAMKNSIIFRLNTIFGWHLPAQRTNCVTWLLKKLQSGAPLRIVDDVFNDFLWLGDACEAIIGAVQRGCTGIYHLGGGESCSRYSFSRQVADVFDFDAGLISPVSSDFFPMLATRPKHASSSYAKLARDLGFYPRAAADALTIMRDSEEMTSAGAA